MKCAFLITIIWKIPKVVRVGAKKITYLKPKNFIKIESSKIDIGKPKKIERILINAKYLYSIPIIKFSKPLLYLRKRANK